MRSTDSDGELMARYQRDHDLAAFEQLFVRHQDALLRYVLRLVGDRAAAEDASQCAWLKLIEAAKKGVYAARQGAAFRTWLFTLARNHVIDEQRRKAALIRTAARTGMADCALLELGVGTGCASVDPADQAMERDFAEWIASALRLLPFEQRDVITLWAVGLDPQEISALTRAPRDTVLSRRKYALAKLRASTQGGCPAGARARSGSRAE